MILLFKCSLFSGDIPSFSEGQSVGTTGPFMSTKGQEF